MLPDNWQELKQLLVICCLDGETLFAQLIPVLNSFQASLPDVKIQLLILNDEKYRFLSLDFHLKSVSSDDSVISYTNLSQLIQEIKSHSFEAAIILTAPDQSPFSLGYLCYLAGVPVRVGQSQEFGGGVLSHCIKPPPDNVSFVEYTLHLLYEAGFPKFEHPELAIV